MNKVRASASFVDSRFGQVVGYVVVKQELRRSLDLSHFARVEESNAKKCICMLPADLVPQRWLLVIEQTGTFQSHGRCYTLRPPSRVATQACACVTRSTFRVFIMAPSKDLAGISFCSAQRERLS